MANKDNINEDEEWYSAQLAKIRSLEGVYKDIQSLKEKGRSFGHPSYIKYSICGSLALLKDGLDIAALLGVFTLPLWWLIGPFLSFIILLIFWLFNIKQKKAEGYIKGLESNMEVIQANIAHAIRVVSRIPGAKKKVAAFNLTKITSFLGRSPTVKVGIGAGLESVPLVSLAPWNIIAVILSYLDERKIYKNAAKNGEEAASQLTSQLQETAQII